MTRTLKLALVVSLVIHAVAFAVLFGVSSNESKQSVNEITHVVLLVPVQEDFIARPVDPIPTPTPQVTAPKPSVQNPKPPIQPEPQPQPTKVEPILSKPVVAPVTPVAPPTTKSEDARPVATANPPPSPSQPTEIAPKQDRVVAKTTNPAATQPALITGRVKYRKAPEPEYPAVARRRRQEGTVLLDVTIGVDGHAVDVKVKQSSSIQILDRAAVEAVQHWEFEITTDVPVRAEIPVRFQLMR